MNMNKSKIALLEIINLGYTMNENGELFDENNVRINGRIDTSGYRVFCKRLKNLKICIPVPFHRIQAYLKFGNKLFEKGIVVRHLNNDKLDNSYSNISIGTNLDNYHDKPDEQKQNDIVRLAIVGAIAGIRHHNVKDIQNFYKQCRSYSKTMQEFGISSKGTLWYIINKR